MPQKASRGFTIVELLIVIVVIAILAAVTIVAYNGIISKARDSQLKADLQGAVKQLEVYKTTNNTYPTSQVSDAGVRNTSNTTFTYTFNPGDNTYCLVGSNGVYTYSITANQTQPGNYACISLLAGAADQSSGTTDGTGTGAQFNTPSFLTLGADNMLYVADGTPYTATIRKIDPTTAGVTTVASLSGISAQSMTVAANGTIYYTSNATSPKCIKKVIGGVVSNVVCNFSLNYPSGIILASDNFLYFADTFDETIKKVNPTTGAITILAGASNSSGYVDATGSVARFAEPNAMALGPDGNIYVTDNTNNRIRKVTLSGQVSTVAGNGSTGNTEGLAMQAEIGSPADIAVDSAGTIYFTDYNEGGVWQLKGGVVSAIAGGQKFPGGSGLAASPTAQGVVYLAVYYKNQIFKLQ